MAKQMSWTQSKTTLTVEHLDGDFEQSFNMADMFEDFEEFNEVQRNVIGYGIKQKLADSCAKSSDEKLTAKEREATMETVWERLVAGEWNAKGDSRQTVKKKVDNAVENASEAELEMMVNLELITEAQMEAELERRAE